MYHAAAHERLQVRGGITGACARMMGYQAIFRVLTNQIDVPAKELCPLDSRRINDILKEVLQADIQIMNYGTCINNKIKV